VQKFAADRDRQKGPFDGASVKGLRLPWLFDNDKLPGGLRELSTAIKEDGNDGAHQGTLTKEDAQDLLDFTTALLERVFTEPKKLELAKERRQQRRVQLRKG
jgi:Domain of unknown function (DUF4145)